ncbi:MAG TPA: Ig-like domain-containing protein [Thermoanaerobaculia bacterium]|nr:Ig-like domain-containing protein [Thermoanaerobaculia bacterium]
MKPTWYARRAFACMLALLLSMPLAAQLNENCTISILNRTAQVNAGGFWQIPNLPADQGPVRARAVCIENGITRVGVSEWMNIPRGGIAFSENVVFQSAPPVPASMTLTATTTTLAHIGDSTQLQVLLLYPDGATRVVNTAAEGTSYTSTNPNVATVSASGLVTATGSGTVIVSAVNEGSLGLLRISIATGPLDSDRDGLPDDWERTYGLNPNNPGDATLDGDGDGLDNRAEFAAGTDPTRADTDGDGVRDGLELETGSDPLDPGSVNLPAALQGIRTAPSAVVLVKNVVDETTLGRVRVEGVLRDGGIIDLTARASGTTYTSSDLQVASFTAIDGEIFAGAVGNATLTVTNGAFTSTAPIVVSTFNPTALARLPMPGHANDVEVSGNFAYVAAGEAGLQVVDVTDRRQPRIVGSYDTAGAAWTLRVAGTRVYIADYDEGLAIVDVSIPTQPQLVAAIPAPGLISDVAVSGDYAYLASDTNGLIVVSLVSNSIVAQLSGHQLVSIDVRGDLVVGGTSFSGVVAYDVTLPSAPVRRGVLVGFPATALRIRENTVFAVTPGFGVFVIDVSNPASLQIIIRDTRPQVGSPRDVHFFDRWMVLPHSFNPANVPLFDVSTVNPPIFRMNVFLGNGEGEWAATGAAIDSTFVYETASGLGPQRTWSSEGSSGTALFIGQWRVLRDDFGFAPTLTIGAASVEGGTTAIVPLIATDDVAVASVMLSVDGQQLPPDTLAPYVFSFPVPAGASSLQLVAQAVDLAGNLTTVNRALPVVPDTTAPSARILIPANGETYGGGANISVFMDASDAGPVTQVEAFAAGVSLGTANDRFGSFNYTVPNVAGTVTFTGSATDHAGNVGLAAPVTITTVPDNPPFVDLMFTPSEPLHSGAEVVMQVTATDDFGITNVDFLVDGAVVRSRTSPPFQYTYEIPPGRSQIEITAIATDTRGQTTQGPSYTLPIRETTAYGAVPLAGYTSDIAVFGAYAFIAADTAGLHVVDVSDPAAPVLVTTLQTPGNANKLDLRWPYLFLAAGSAGLQVVNVADPAAPEVIASLATSGAAHDVFYRNDRVYIGQEFGFDIVNVADPRAPKRIVFRATQKPVTSIAAREGALYLSMEHTNPDLYYMRLIHGMSITNEANPTNGSTLQLQTGKHANLAIHNDRLYVSAEYELFVVRATSASPVLLGRTTDQDFHCCYSDAKISGVTAVVAGAEHNLNDVQLVNVSIPQSPRLVGTIDFSTFGPYFGLAVDITPELAFTVGIDQYPDSLQRRDLTTSKLFTGRYRTVTDTNGVMPQAIVTAPLNGANAIAGQTLRVQVSALDDVGVKTVRIFADGVRIAETSTAPYEILHALPPGAGTVTFTAVSIDYAGSETTSAPVTVNVSADATAPTARVTLPVAGKSLLGQTLKLAAEATDNVSVSRVEFVVDGSVVATDRTLPYEVVHQLPADTGSATFTVRAFDPSGNMTESAPVVANVSLPQAVGAVAMPSLAYDLDTNGNTAVVATETGVTVVDLSTLSSPAVLATVPTPSAAVSVRLLGNYAYAGCLNGELVTIDIATPSAPVTVFTSGGGSAYKLALSRLTAYTMWGSLKLWNVSVPSAPVASSFNAGEGAIDADDPRFVVGRKDLRAFNGGTLTASRTLFDSWTSSQIMSLRFRNGYVAAGLWPASGFMVLNVDDKLSWLTWAGGSSSASYVDFLDDTLVTVGDSAQASLYDFTNPREPLLRATVDLGAGGMTAVRLTHRHLLAVSTGGLHVAKYRDFTDTAGTPPTAAVTAFVGTARAGRLYNLRADATDNVGVAQVVFNVNGTDVFTDTIAPYELNYLIPTGTTRLDVRARAIDYAGNETLSAVRTVFVSP